jgi:hypothetical protein
VVQRVRIAVLAAAFVLAVASRGDVVVLAVLLGLGAGRRSSGLAAAGALGAAMVRWGSPSLDAIAGAQSVLGPAGWTGSSAAIASAWLGAVALVLATRSIGAGSTTARALAAAPFAAAAADVVIGPSAGLAVLLRVVAAAVALALATWRTAGRRVPWDAEVCAALALVTAALAR